MLPGSDGGAAGDAESDVSSGDAEGDAQGDAGCFSIFDCRESFSDECNDCPWPLSRLVCLAGQCVCTCGAKDAGGD